LGDSYEEREKKKNGTAEEKKERQMKLLRKPLNTKQITMKATV
jgi:hypothetical protein